MNVSFKYDIRKLNKKASKTWNKKLKNYKLTIFLINVLCLRIMKIVILMRSKIYLMGE